MEPDLLKARSCWAMVALALAAEAQGPVEPPRRVAPPSRIPDVALKNLEPQGTPVNTASMPREVRRAVVADAARRFQVAENAVVLSHAEQVTWRDGSLGCPLPGHSYAQALVPGFRVAATTGAGRMTYHTDTRGNVVTCGVAIRP
jgi:hypothetical protein